MALHVADTRAAVILVDEIAQVRAEGPVTKLLFMQQVQIALLIDVFELRVPGANQRLLFVKTVFGARVVETVRHDGGSRPGREVLHVRGVTQAHGGVLTCLQAQARELSGHQRGALEGLWQQAPVIVAQQRNIRHELAEHQLGVGHTHFCRHPRAPVVVGGVTIVVHRQQLRSER